MKRGPMQEKFEFHGETPKQNHQWASAESARRSAPVGSQRVGGASIRGTKLNQLPPGDNCGDAQIPPKEISERRALAGSTDVSRDANKQALANGFTRLPMAPTEDMESNEHNIPFYDDATVDGATGFVERSNVLDRQ